jgi:hypothetical protein
MNFATFFTQAVQDKTKKAKKGKYKGHPKSVTSPQLRDSGPIYYKQPNRMHAPSSNTFSLKG